MLKKFEVNTKLPDNLLNTSSYEYIKYPFSNFNKVQSLLVDQNYYKKNINLVLATNTSTGKTVAAELFMGHALYKQNKKVIYVSPLKSLTQEKYDDWSNKFKDKTVTILTSDYSNDSKIFDKLQYSDIICITSEMLDSKTRSINQLLKWGKDVGLIIIDEFHILDMEGRGHAVEAGLMRFCKYCACARILCLSATVPNVEDFRKWFNNLNAKSTIVIKSEWRPVKLGFHYVRLTSGNNYRDTLNNKIMSTVNILNSKPDQKFLCFVHDKNTGRQLTSYLNKKGINCNFHCADVSFKDRQEFETDFSDKQNGNRVLVSTSTLAWGRSLPARNVIIVGSMRGSQSVDEFDILQMAGRAGRLGIDDEGDCYFLTHNVDTWKALLKNLKNVNSTLIEKDFLEFQICAEIAIGNINNMESLENWYKKSLAFIQDKGDMMYFNECLVNLKMYNMIDYDSTSIEIKQLGKVSANLYFLPRDIVSLSKKLYKINGDINEYTLAYLLGNCQSWSMPYVPRDLIKQNNEFAYSFRNATGINIKACNTTYNLYKYISKDEKNVYNFQVVKDMKRIDSALSWIASIKKLDYFSIV